MNKREQSHNQTSYVKIGLFLLLFYGIFFGVGAVGRSILFSPQDRLNLVFYSDKTHFLSLSRSQSVHYTLAFDNEIEVAVPGGYGRYRIGALGRLSDIDKKPVIIQKAFSSATSSYVDYYFLPKKNAIHDFDDETDPKTNLPKFSLMTVFFAKNYYTNAGFFDRLYLFFLLLDKRKTDFIGLSARTLSWGKGNVFSEDSFQKKYKGFFYQAYLRNEEKNVKIVYRTYKSAKTLSRIIEGQGIRVVDLEHLEDKNISQDCSIKEQGKPSQTSRFLAHAFGCKIGQGEVSGADIAFSLGTALEKGWE